MSTDIAELMLKAAEELRKIAAENAEMKERIFRLESALKKSPEQTDHSAVHLHHCNNGEYEGSCKYSEDDCPAMAHAALKARWASVQEPVAVSEVLVKIARFLGVVQVYAQDINPKHELETDKPLHWKARELQGEVISLLDSIPPTAPPKNIRVHGWVWKDKQTEDDCYIPSYTPAQHVAKGELLALVDPADLHEPLQNTKWF